MDVTEYETLVVERRGPVGWLIFDRPEVANAMDARMLAELETAWRELDDDPEVRAIVNTGAGAAFQTGLDVVQLSRDPAALREQSRRTKRAELRISVWHNGVRTPVIAAINGVCAGGGLHFVADADVVIAASTASFLDPHVSIGQVSAFEVITLLRKIPAEAVFRMALLGRHERIDRRARASRSASSARSSRPTSSWRRRRRSASGSPPIRRMRTLPPSARCGTRSRPVRPRRDRPRIAGRQPATYPSRSWNFITLPDGLTAARRRRGPRAA